MKLTASEVKRLAALRAKATLTEAEDAALAALEAKTEGVVTINDVVNPEAYAVITGIAEIKLRDNAPEKPVLIRLVEKVGDTDILLLSAQQANNLAATINIFDKGVAAWQQMKTLVGNRRSEIELSVQKQLAGSSYTNKNGVVVVRDEEGFSVLPQMIILPTEIQRSMDENAVKTVVRTWSSSAKFLPKPVKAEEEMPL